MYNRVEIQILLTNWGLWARGNGCPKYHGTLTTFNNSIEYDSALAEKVEKALLSISLKTDITPLIYYYVYKKEPGTICQIMKISVDHYTKIIEKLEDELSIII